MAYTPTPPTVDPSQKGPVLSGANDVPYVGKPKPQPQRAGQPPRYGSSDGSGFDFQKYLAGQHRPRPVQVLPGQGMGPMPVGTKPLPNPVVKDGRGLITATGPDYYSGYRGGARDFMDRGTGSLSPDGKGGFLTPDGRTVQIPNYGNMQDVNGWPDQGGQLKPGGMGLDGRGGLDFDKFNDPFYRGTRFPSPDEIARHEAKRGGQGGGMTAINSDARINPDGSVSTRNNNNGWDPWNPGAQFGGTQVQMKPGGMGAGGVDPSTGVWTPPSDEYMRGLEGGQIAPKWAGAPGSKEYEGWLNSDQRKARLESRGTVNDNYDTSGQGAINRTPGGPPPVGTGPGSMGKPQQPGGMPSREGGARHRGQRPPQAPVNPQALQQGAEALYGDNTIPHEFKGQLLQAAQSGDAQAFNDMLFNSGIPHETKLRLQQMFGYGSGAPTQAATPDQGVRQAGPPGGFDPRMGSGYYGAF